MLLCGAGRELLLNRPWFCGARCGAGCGVKRRKLLLFCWFCPAALPPRLKFCGLWLGASRDLEGALLENGRQLD